MWLMDRGEICSLRGLGWKLWFSLFLAAVAGLFGVPAVPVAADLTVIASDDFETGSYSGGPGWVTGWQASTAVTIVSTRDPHSGSRHLEMRGSAIVSRVIDLSGWTDVELGFWAKARSLEARDQVVLEVSPDGRTWETLETWADGDDDDRYHLYEFDLAGQNIADTLQVRFLSQMDDPEDYFYIDDVLIQGEPVRSGALPAVRTGLPVSPVISTLAASSSGGIVVDGAFSDWSGYPNLSDPSGDATKVRGDMSAFYWGNNGGSEVNFWMIERYPGNENDDEDDEGEDEDDEESAGGSGNSQTKKVKYTIFLDTNDDGDFSGDDDRRVLVDYKPKADHSDVRVRVKRGTGGQTLYSADGDWGESKAEGGRRVELGVFWTELGISSGNVIRMYVESNRNDRLPNSGDIQWSPASILGFWLLSALVSIGAVALWRLKKRQEERCLSGQE